MRSEPPEAGPLTRQTYTVEETGKLLGIGRVSAYLAVRNGDIRAIQIGRRLLVPRREIERMLNGETASAP